MGRLVVNVGKGWNKRRGGMGEGRYIDFFFNHVCIVPFEMFVFLRHFGDVGPNVIISCLGQWLW